MTAKTPSEQTIRDIRRATRKHYSAEDKIKIVLDGLRGEYSIAEPCRREGIAESLYYRRKPLLQAVDFSETQGCQLFDYSAGAIGAYDQLSAIYVITAKYIFK